jgi:hypothetical protein
MFISLDDMYPIATEWEGDIPSEDCVACVCVDAEMSAHARG